MLLRRAVRSSQDLGGSSGPVGPRTIEEWTRWPVEVMPRLLWAERTGCLPGAAGRFVRRLKSGCGLVSAYSGQGSAEQAALYTDIEQQAIGNLCPDSGDVGFRTLQASDIKQVCRLCLKSFPGAHRPGHVLGDLLARLPTDILEKINALTPTAEEYRHHLEVVEAAHEAIDALLRTNIDCCFNDDTRCHCDLHDRSCLIYDTTLLTPHMLTWFAAGVTCLDVSRAGLRRGKLGPHHVPLMVWYWERRKRQEDLGLLECTPDVDIAEAEARLGDIYDISSIVLSSRSLLGIHYERERTFLSFHKKATVVSCSSIDTFVDIFGCAPPSDDCPSSRLQGDMFWCAPAAIVQDELRKEATRHGLELPVEWPNLLSPGNSSRLQGYEELRMDYLSAHLELPRDVLHLADEGGRDQLPPIICDLSQEPTERPRLASHLMTLMQKTIPWSFRMQRPLLGQESLVAQGVPVFDFLTDGGRFQCPYAPLLDQMGQASQRSLAGNMICIPLIGKLMSFVMASTETREQMQLRALPFLEEADSDDDEDLRLAEAKRQRISAA